MQAGREYREARKADPVRHAAHLASQAKFRESEQGQQYRKEYRKGRVEAIVDVIRAAKAKPCMDCGIEYPPYVMDFDHVRGEKKFNIARATKDKPSMEVLLAEIEKCDPVCANCHRIRTHERGMDDE